jgi:hypothetical protein
MTTMAKSTRVGKKWTRTLSRVLNLAMFAPEFAVLRHHTRHSATRLLAQHTTRAHRHTSVAPRKTPELPQHLSPPGLGQKLVLRIGVVSRARFLTHFHLQSIRLT